MSNSITVRSLQAQLITVENFRPYGQLITPSNDGKMFDESDAQLNLHNGVPRFYIMRLQTHGRKFNRITRHSQCTQCLGSLGGQEWFMGVAPPSSHPQPDLEKLRVFRIPGDCFIKLEVGTWHAGPLFDPPAINFYNLELSDTNIIDHFTYNFAQEQSIEFEIID
jgi:ureidoglycolate hydrolase